MLVLKVLCRFRRRAFWVGGLQELICFRSGCFHLSAFFRIVSLFLSGVLTLFSCRILSIRCLFFSFSSSFLEAESNCLLFLWLSLFCSLRLIFLETTTRYSPEIDTLKAAGKILQAQSKLQKQKPKKKKKKKLLHTKGTVKLFQQGQAFGFK